MEDKTGIFNKPDHGKEERKEEDTLASIFAKRTEMSQKSAPVTEKTTVIERADLTAKKADVSKGFAVKTEPEFLEDEDDEENQPFLVKDSPIVKAARERRKSREREQLIRDLKSQQTGRTFAHILGGILLVVMIVTVSSFLSYYIIRAAVDFTGIAVSEFSVLVEIPEDALTSEIAAILHKQNLISMPKFFTLYSQLFGYDGHYLGGTFMLNSSMTYSALIRNLQSTASVRETVMVTIPEGLTAEEIGRLLEENFVCRAEDFMYYYSNKHNRYNFERRLPFSSLKFHQLEGYLFPETYEFFVVDALRDGLNFDTLSENQRETIKSYARTAAFKFFSHFDSMITREMYKMMGERGLTLDELITLASMVQAEAAAEDDMRKVASVFLNRMSHSEDFPHMQSDPTGYYANNFIRPHVNQNNIGAMQAVLEAYDTYLSPGLPPGPINNPGMDAIMAVLNPEKTNYFYFCANIETGEVFYARTLAEHEVNLARVASEMTGIS